MSLQRYHIFRCKLTLKTGGGEQRLEVAKARCISDFFGCRPLNARLSAHLSAPDGARSPLQDPAAGFKEAAPELSEVLNNPVCERNGTAEWRASVPQALDCRAEAAV